MATTCETESQWERAAQHRVLRSALCDDREGGTQGVGGRPMTEGIHGYILLIHAGTQRKVTQHCKAIISQFFKKESHFYHQNQTHKRGKMRVRKRKEKEEQYEKGVAINFSLHSWVLI